MPYVTVFRPPRVHQISFEEILAGEVAVCPAMFRTTPVTDTITRYYERIGPELVRKFDIPSIITQLRNFNLTYSALFESDRASLYHTFHIPKRTGGLRRIDAPNDDLMNALRVLKSIFENSCGALYHTSAFAYVPHRSTIDAIKRHQGNASRWFLKTDFSDFFGNTTEDFLFHMLSQIFPFSEIVASPSGQVELRKALSLCFLNGGLPQGTPISPMLTNLACLPIDFKLMNSLKKRGFVYTRYADDILISSKYSFMFTDVVKEINSTLASFSAPFRLKREKTRYGSSNGANWNLGVMLNQNNEITIGWKKKKHIRAMTHNYLMDKQSGVNWDPHDVAVFSGLLSYCNMVEPTFFNQLLRHAGEKYHVNLLDVIKADLNGGVRNETQTALRF